MQLNCGPCIVRDWRETDRDSLLRFANNRNVWRNLSHRFPHPYTGAEATVKAQSDRERPRFDGKSQIREIKVLGGWAFMWTELTVVVTPPDGGPSMTRAGHTLSVLKRENGKWVLARDANMLSPVSAGGE